MVAAVFALVQDIPLFLRTALHGPDGLPLPVVGTQVHALDAQPVLIGEELHSGAVQPLLPFRLLDGPVERLPGDKLGQADHGDPVEPLLVGKVDGSAPLHPPQALQGRHHIVNVALQLMLAQLAHFDGVCHRVQLADGRLVGSVLLVGVPLAPHGEKVHGGDLHDLGCLRGQVKLLVLLFIVKRHSHFLLFLTDWARSASQVTWTSRVSPSRSSTSSASR